MLLPAAGAGLRFISDIQPQSFPILKANIHELHRATDCRVWASLSGVEKHKTDIVGSLSFHGCLQDRLCLIG